MKHKSIPPFLTGALTVKRLIRRFYTGFLSVRKCVLCGAEGCQEMPVCRSCIEREFQKLLEEQIENRAGYCSLCGVPLVSETEYCTECRSKITQTVQDFLFERIFSLYPYKGSGGEIVAEWKNKGERGLAGLFAEAASKFIARTPELKGLPIVPMPPRPKKLKTKGWDQIEDLAQYLEVFHGAEIVRVLKRSDSAPQKSLSKAERAVNLKGKIRLQTAEPLPGAVILLDDVITTGATLNACADVLKQGGCKKIYGLCLFFD